MPLTSAEKTAPTPVSPAAQAPAPESFRTVTPPTQNTEIRQTLASGTPTPANTPSAPQEAAAKPAAPEVKIAEGTGMGKGIEPSPEVRELQTAMLKVNEAQVREIHNKHYGDRGPEGVEKVLTDGKYGKATAESVAATREMLGLSREGGVSQEFLDKLKAHCENLKAEAKTTEQAGSKETADPSTDGAPAPSSDGSPAPSNSPEGTPPADPTNPVESLLPEALAVATDYPAQAGFLGSRSGVLLSQGLNKVATFVSKTPWVGSVLGEVTNLPAGLAKLGGKVLYPVAPGIEAYNAYQEEIKENPADSTRAYTKAAGAGAGALGGILAAMKLGSAIGAGAGTVVPGAGNVVGGIVGAVSGLAIGVVAVWGGGKMGCWLSEFAYDRYAGSSK